MQKISVNLVSPWAFYVLITLTIYGEYKCNLVSSMALPWYCLDTGLSECVYYRYSVDWQLLTSPYTAAQISWLLVSAKKKKITKKYWNFLVSFSYQTWKKLTEQCQANTHRNDSENTCLSFKL